MTQPAITLYGIPNCDTVKKARKWLESNNTAFRFHDFRKDGLTPEQLQYWLDALGWETLLNRKGTTWRQLPESVRNEVTGENIAGLLLAHPTLIKRPVLDTGKGLHCGFKEADYQRLLS